MSQMRELGPLFFGLGAYVATRALSYLLWPRSYTHVAAGLDFVSLILLVMAFALLTKIMSK